MRSFAEAQAARVLAAFNTPEERVKRNQCPVPTCNGDLDTGGECNDCGHDALALAVETECAAMPRVSEGTTPMDAHQVIHDGLMDSQYLAGITAGWNAAQAADPEAALVEVRKSREGHLAGFKEAKAAILSPVTNEGEG